MIESPMRGRGRQAGRQAEKKKKKRVRENKQLPRITSEKWQSAMLLDSSK